VCFSSRQILIPTELPLYNDSTFVKDDSGKRTVSYQYSNGKIVVENRVHFVKLPNLIVFVKYGKREKALFKTVQKFWRLKEKKIFEKEEYLHIFEFKKKLKKKIESNKSLKNKTPSEFYKLINSETIVNEYISSSTTINLDESPQRDNKNTDDIITPNSVSLFKNRFQSSLQAYRPFTFHDTAKDITETEGSKSGSKNQLLSTIFTPENKNIVSDDIFKIDELIFDNNNIGDNNVQKNNQVDVSERKFVNLIGLSSNQYDSERFRVVDMHQAREDSKYLAKTLGFKDQRGSYTSMSFDLFSDSYVQFESRTGGSRNIGRHVNAAMERTFGSSISAMDPSSVNRAVVAKSLQIDEHFVSILPELEDIGFTTGKLSFFTF